MTIVGTLTIFFLMKQGLSLLASNFLGYLITICISFFLNKFFVFRSKINAFGKFIFFFFSAYLINVFFLYLGNYLALNPFITQSIAIFSYAASMYFFLRAYVFIDSKSLKNFSR
jgi:putative flippase GtrA